MNIWVIGSTKKGYVMSKEEALAFSGKSARICYMRKAIQKIFEEPDEKSIERVQNNIAAGHHSVCGHVHYNLAIEHIPKILSMLLNNEKIYDTSEKSARYTRMRPSPEEKERYDKWIALISECISHHFPSLKEDLVEKLAQENARYMISVFTPATIMEYSVNFRQINYLMQWARNFIGSNKTDAFSMKLRPVLQDFLLSMPDLEVDGLQSSTQHDFSLFATRKRYEEFGENYSVNYLTSFAGLAQAHRHRTGDYEMQLLEEPKFYVPPILRDNDKLVSEWLEDINGLADRYPQGMLVQVNERGSIENFIAKCHLRLCGKAQLEIMECTDATMKRYLEETRHIPELHQYLLPYSHGPKCTFPGEHCTESCIFGPKNALHRII